MQEILDRSHVLMQCHQLLADFAKGCDSIKAYYNEDNIWRSLHIERDENRHSAFIAWVLGLHFKANADSPMSNLLRLSQKFKNNNIILIDTVHIENEKVISSISSINSNDRIDIYAICDATVDGQKKKIEVVIENKIDSKEGDAKVTKNIVNPTLDEQVYVTLKQTARYHFALEKGRNRNQPGEQVFFYLSPDKNAHPSSSDFECITYQDVVNLMEKYIKSRPDNYTKRTIEEYLKNMSNTKNHKQPIALTSQEMAMLNKYFDDNVDMILLAIEAKINAANNNPDLRNSLAQVKAGLLKQRSNSAQFSINGKGSYCMYEVVDEFARYLMGQGKGIDEINRVINGYIGSKKRVNISLGAHKVTYHTRTTSSGKVYSQEYTRPNMSPTIYITKQWSAFGDNNPNFRRLQEGINKDYSEFQIQDV